MAAASASGSRKAGSPTSSSTAPPARNRSATPSMVAWGYGSATRPTVHGVVFAIFVPGTEGGQRRVAPLCPPLLHTADYLNQASALAACGALAAGTSIQFTPH